jgi:hypothetical protein
MIMYTLKYSLSFCLALIVGSGVFNSAEKYGAELEKYVKSGFVDYKSWSKEHDGLDGFIESLKNAKLDSLSANQTKALLINAYNAGMIKSILENYPLESVSDIEPNVFGQKSIDIGGKMYSLDDIENGFLRKMGDNRIHFTIVCGSMGCPDLSSEIYRPQAIDEQLDSAGKRYLSQDKGMTIDKDSATVSVSMIFNWFGSDFGKTEAEQLVALSQYLDKEDAAFIRENADKIKVNYIDYNWSLNGE